MDPNANLAEQHRLLNHAGRMSADDRARLAELREALAGWLQRGGFAPNWGHYAGNRVLTPWIKAGWYQPPAPQWGYLAEPFDVLDRPLWFHTAGRQQTASGYGSKLTSARCVRLPGETRLRRVYVTQWSNSGTAWVRIKGQTFVIRDLEGTRVES